MAYILTHITRRTEAAAADGIDLPVVKFRNKYSARLIFVISLLSFFIYMVLCFRNNGTILKCFHSNFQKRI